MFKGDKKVPAWLAIIIFCIGVLLGNGALWQWENLQLAQRAQSIEEIKQSAEIRKNISDLQQKIINITIEYMNLIKLDKENLNLSISTKGVILKERLKVLKDDFTNLEANLAQMEGREPRVIDLEFLFRPVPPFNLHTE